VKSSVVTKEAVESALDTLLNVSVENEYQSIQVFSAFEQPVLKFEPTSKMYEILMGQSCRLHADPKYRVNMYRERYYGCIYIGFDTYHSMLIVYRFLAVERRVQRHKTFSKPIESLEAGKARDYLEVLHMITFLI
jgi:hypothetical protein